MSTIQQIGTSEVASDFDCNGIVTPFEALSVVRRIGYLRPAVVGDNPPAQSAVLGTTLLQSASMVPSLSLPVLAEEAKIDTAQTPSVRREVVMNAYVADDDSLNHDSCARDASLSESVSVVPEDLPQIDEEFSDVREWLTLI